MPLSRIQSEILHILLSHLVRRAMSRELLLLIKIPSGNEFDVLHDSEAKAALIV